MLQKLGKVGLIVVIAALLLVPTAVAIYFARDAGIQVGRYHEMAAENERLLDSLDLAQVELAEAEYRVATVEDLAQQMQAELDVSIPVWDALWCNSFLGMGINPQVLEERAALVLQTIEYVKAFTQAEGATMEPQVCVVTISITHGSVRDEIYVLASRAFQGGDPELFQVYWATNPENAEEYVIVGHYDIGAREWHTHVRDGNPDN